MLVPYVKCPPVGGLASRARALALRSRPRAESGADDLTSSIAPSAVDKAPIHSIVLTTANEDGVSQAVCYVEASSPSTPVRAVVLLVQSAHIGQARYLLVLFQRDLPDKPMPGAAFTILSPWYGNVDRRNKQLMPVQGFVLLLGLCTSCNILLAIRRPPRGPRPCTASSRVRGSVACAFN